MKWTSFTQLRMEIIKTIKNREVIYVTTNQLSFKRRQPYENNKNYFNNEKENKNII